MHVRLPSLETRWLPRDGMVPQPAVAFLNLPDVGGFYLPPGVRDGELDGGRNGLVVVSTHFEDLDMESTLAHEHRHHRQYWRGQLPERPVPWDQATLGPTYEEAIARYFSENWHELDALRFQRRIVPRDEGTEWWLELTRRRLCSRGLSNFSL